jgi:RecQ-mediated genome instability protein 1
MAPPPQVVQWLKETYPKPYIDPVGSKIHFVHRLFTTRVQEWLDACYTWIIEEYNLSPLIDVDKIMESVESQLLQSDLRDSMLPGTGLPANISELTNVTIRGPFLVEIVAITEIGHSAFTLQNTRQVRMDRADLAGLGPEVADEDEGPIPKYPRSMLRFELSDGATTLQAMEYRPLPEIQLGVTPLGYKVCSRLSSVAMTVKPCCK